METENKINEILDTIRPFLINEGGNIEFVRYDNKTGKITYEFRGWGNATNNYNGGGVQNYQNDVETMVREVKPRE